MEAFNLTLANGANLSGEVCIPSSTGATPTHKPLIVALHGGTMSSQYFNATTATSASGPATAFGVPFVAINRPGYRDTTPLPAQPPQDSTWFQEEGRFLHEQVLPAIWSRYAQPAEASCLVLLGHSMGVPSTVVAAALSSTIHAPSNTKDAQSGYVLGGIIVSGWGVQQNGTKEQIEGMIRDNTWTDRLGLAVGDMFLTALYGTPEQGFVDTEIRNHDVLASQGFSYGEMVDGNRDWAEYWKEKYASKVQVPVFHAMGGADLLWSVSRENVDEFAQAFTAARWVEKRMTAGTPHCLEVSRWSRMWYLRCFAFAADCAAEAAASTKQ